MVAAALIGVAAGIIAGLLGVGGGILFVPALVIFVGLAQVDAEATSLLAIVPVAAVGAWRQDRYGNVRHGDAAWLAVLSAAGVLGGVALANLLPARTLQVGFAILTLLVAGSLVRRVVRGTAEPGTAEGRDPGGEQPARRGRRPPAS